MRDAIVTAAFALIPGALCAQQIDVLFIGNSYTGANDLPNSFRQLALSLGDTVSVASVTPGGYTFQGHSVYTATLDAIASQPWDFVVLQEQSQIPSFPIEQVEQISFPFATQLVAAILANDSCTQPVFYMTWGRQNGDADNCDTWPPVCTYEGMQALLRERYLQMAFDNDAFAAPAGVAWKNLRDQYPMLNLYVGDGSHPSVAGTYVVANTMYATMFRASTVGASFTMGLAADTALIIQGIASTTVLDSLSTWNIGVSDPDASFTLETFDSCELMFHPASPGAHFWDFGDGSTSEASDPFHLFASGDPVVTVTHTVTDACGRTATFAVEINACAVGIADHGAMNGLRIHPVGDGLLKITNPSHVRGNLVLMDGMGRRATQTTGTDGRTLRTALRGPILWRFTADDGSITSGRTFLP
jgi:hypothetical protein